MPTLRISDIPVVRWIVPLLIATAATAAEPLHTRIDALLEVQPGFARHRSALTGDAEFARRVYLDLVGRIPTANEVQKFLGGPGSQGEKRGRLIDQLLRTPEHAYRMQSVFSEMLMEREAATNVSEQEWNDYLYDSFRSNKPWDQMTRELLAGTGAEQRSGPGARFVLDRVGDMDKLTRDIGRVFLGVDLECAQCHDHPFIDDYLQRHYYGLTAFVKRTYLFTDPKTKKKSLGERAEGEITFTSVFTSESGKTQPRLMDLAEIKDPAGSAKQYIIAPKKDARAIPKYSRREQLPSAMIGSKNPRFAENIVNRIWALLMGRGLVEPLDVWHEENTPSHPGLLKLLASEFRQHDFDIRWLISELTRTKAYQRSSSLVPGAEQELASTQFAVGLLKPLSPEQLCLSIMQATDQMNVEFMKGEAALLKKQPSYLPNRRGLPSWRMHVLQTALRPKLATFAATFASQGGQKTSFDAAAHQALFLINGELVHSWLKPATYEHFDRRTRRTQKKGNLTKRLDEMKSDPVQFSQELYQSVLNRPPTGEEVREVREYLKVADKSAAQDLVWVLLTSAEFRFNH